VSANLSSRVQRGICTLLVVSLAGCSWFTDFKEQPKIDPWDTPNDSTPPRGNPQGSVPIHGSVAPEFMYARNTQALESMSGLANPVAMSQESVDRGRKSYQINCAVCHGPMGAGSGVVMKYGIYPPALNGAATQARSDGYIFAVIRNGKNLMPSYNRIEDHERWDVVNYVRTLQGRGGIAADSSHGRPGETGQYLVGASATAPTRPAPFFSPRLTVDTTKPPVQTPAPAAHKPPTPEAQQ
jgi:mono/diheme cytochrome c family protein